MSFPVAGFDFGIILDTTRLGAIAGDKLLYQKSFRIFFLQGDVDDNVDGLKVELVGGNLPLRPCQPGDHRGEIVIIIIMIVLIII